MTASMTASCVCVVYRRRRADADTHRPRRKVRDAVRRSPTQSYLVKAFLQPATERNHNHAHRTATRVRQMRSTGTERPTMPMPPSLRRKRQPGEHPTTGASYAPPNCGRTRSASTTVVVDPPSRSITCSHSAKAATVGTGRNLASLCREHHIAKSVVDAQRGRTRPR